MGAEFGFAGLETKSKTIRGTTTTALKHKHPGGAFSWKMERNDKSFVYCTDIEHGKKFKPKILEFCQGLDLLIHDAQYTSKELESRKGWGHSSYDQAIEFAELAGVKQLILTHHDPDHDDKFLAAREKECQNRFANCLLARDGMEIDL